MRTAYKFHAGSNRKYAESQRPVEFFAGVSGADYFSVNKIERCRKLQKRLHGEKVLYVGDTEMDIELADCMGYDSCLAKTGYGWYEDETYILQVLRPDYVVLELKEILKFV